ncbi:aldehyde dehydrogenase family protein [Streptomyces mirabilis]|uniref:aldehyde dehydrogenase family protein n=1 Tax=Streptomyces mirabilis TaxID=68239 RepID=UPI0036DE437E
MTILLCAAEFADQRATKVARTISSESVKTITEATGEAARSGDLIRLAAFEGIQLYGETLPLDAHRGTGQDKVGCTLRQSCGVVVAICGHSSKTRSALHRPSAPASTSVNRPSRATCSPCTRRSSRAPGTLWTSGCCSASNRERS